MLFKREQTLVPCRKAFGAFGTICFIPYDRWKNRIEDGDLLGFKGTSPIYQAVANGDNRPGFLGVVEGEAIADRMGRQIGRFQRYRRITSGSLDRFVAVRAAGQCYTDDAEYHRKCERVQSAPPSRVVVG